MLYAMKITLVAFALVAGFACAQSAGIKGALQQPEEAQLRIQAVKGPGANRPQQQQQPYLPPPPPQAPAPAAVSQQAIKAGPGQVAPVFSAVRVAPQQPAPQPQPQQQQEPEIVQQQQQQQQVEEVDPNAAAQDSAPAVLAPARAAAASEEEANPRPEPYAFQYAFDSGDATSSGSSAREEQQDASGRVTGKCRRGQQQKCKSCNELRFKGSHQQRLIFVATLFARPNEVARLCFLCASVQVCSQ